MANLRDVARRAGVDPSTASRVLRGDPTQQVRPETRERILSAARELAYRPNALARGLRTRRTDTIGLIIPSLDNLGFADVTHGIQAEAAAAGRLVMVVDAGAAAPPGGDPEGVAAAAYERLIGDGRLDGLIVAFATLDDRQVARLAAQGVPLVLVNRRTIGVHGSVVVDDARGIGLAVEHLAGLGHRRIGLVALDADTDTARRRVKGYRTAMAAAGLPVEERWSAADEPTVEGGRRAADRLLAGPRRNRPTGLVVASLMSAVGVLAALRDAGIRVPEQLSVVAFNDHPFADHTAPPLTTVRMPNRRMGEEAVRMLVAALQGAPVGDVVVPEPPELVTRRSTAPPPG